MKKILMIALDYPPCQSAGVQRTLFFKEYLEKNGWQPLVLTAKPFIYDKYDSTQINNDEHFNPPVYRAFGFNALKHFSINGKHFEFTTFPDRFSTWRWDGVRIGKKIIDNEHPEVIWTTFPCSTAMYIGLKLKQNYDLPWVVDFRDPFSGTNPYIRSKNPKGKEIDEQVVKSADQFIFTTNNTADVYLKEYPFLDQSKVTIIPNGYNEKNFNGFMIDRVSEVEPVNKNTFTILHSGFLYAGGRSIDALIMALVELKKESVELFNAYCFVFRGASLDSDNKLLLKKYSLENKIVFVPSISYEESIGEMFSADALLVLQGEVFNNQIPGKLYEYIRAKKPIIALAHKDGATAQLCKNIPHASFAEINNKNHIRKALEILHDIKVDPSFDPSQFSREAGARTLKKVLESIVNDGRNK